jgi:hypothetical protein
VFLDQLLTKHWGAHGVRERLGGGRMYRHMTVRAVIATLAAVLLALPFLAATAPFASAHTGRPVEAGALPEIAPEPTSLRDESVTHGACPLAAGAGGPLGHHHRPRHADAAPQAPERPLPAPDPTTATPRPSVPGATHIRPSRASADRAPAALQVFRC